MSVRASAESLRQIPLFAECDPAHLQIMAFASERANFAQGADIFRAGSTGSAAYLLLSGEADVWKSQGDTRVDVATRRARRLSRRARHDCRRHLFRECHRQESRQRYPHHPRHLHAGGGRVSRFRHDGVERSVAQAHGFRHRIRPHPPACSKAPRLSLAGERTTGQRLSVAITGTWSEGCGQPRASRRISIPWLRRARSAVDQIWSSLRPRLDNCQSRAR